MINQKALKEFLKYHPDTGAFIRIKPVKGANTGDIAGYNHPNGYIYISLKSKRYRAHRLAWLYMTGKWPENQIDHGNHIRDDNRWVNLCEATHKENGKNLSLSKQNKSGICGVSYHKATKTWRSDINVNYKQVHLGCYKDKFEAICARLSANNKYGFHKNHGVPQ